MAQPGWHHSFYWRIAASFVALVVVVVLGQSVIVSYVITRPDGPFAPGNPNAAAGAIAVALGAALADGAGDTDIAALLRRSTADTPQPVFVVMSDGRVAGTSGQSLNPEILRQAQAMLASVAPQALPNARPTGPVVSAPVHVRGQLRGLVLLPPPPERGVFGEVRRLLSLPGTLVLLVSAAAAALLIFAPARRRLRALESAAERLRAGDLTAHAPDEGRDEIAHVAGAFNRMASDLAARNEALRTSDALRRQMLADVSHELKTPLTAMAGFLDTLAMDDVELDATTRKRYLATVRHETTRLRRIVSDLLDLATHENEVGSLDIRVFDIERVFSHVLTRHERDAIDAGVTLRTHVEEGADQLLADPDRIEQAIGNLVANALRHTPAGGAIELRAIATPAGPRLTVTDTGTGIAPEHLGRLFERFYKVDGARTSGAGGSGLGLSIVKAIVVRHRGSITVDSRPGHTAFVIDLPHAPVSANL